MRWIAVMGTILAAAAFAQTSSRGQEPLTMLDTSDSATTPVIFTEDVASRTGVSSGTGEEYALAIATLNRGISDQGITGSRSRCIQLRVLNIPAH